MRRVFLACAASVLVACTGLHDPGEESRDQLLTRASFDLACPRKELHAVTIDERTEGVRGCNQRATYVTTCDRDNFGFDPRCTWVVNTQSRRDRPEDP